ncbi:MAG: prolyl oligopeptidase family serine peptidase [Balneolaceae bacterium]
MVRNLRNLSVLMGVFCVITLGEAFAQIPPDFTDAYLTPPETISKEILAPDYQNVTLDEMSPKGDYFLNSKRNGIPSLSEYSREYYNLGGLQIDHRANRSRSLTTHEATGGLVLVNTRTGEKMELEIPDEMVISNPQWSPDGSKIAWMGHEMEATHLYVTDIQSGSSKRVTTQPVLATLNTTFQWAADSRNIFAVLIPENRGNEPVRPDTPVGLKVRTTSEAENRLPTYPSLLKDHFEEVLLEYYVRGQLVKLDTQNSLVQPIGDAEMIRSIEAAPSGEHVIVKLLQKPFSHIVPVSKFGWKEEIWDLNGDALTTLKTSQTRDGVSGRDTIESYGRRNISWRPDGRGLSMIVNGKKRDEVIQWLPPFGDEDMIVLFSSKQKLNRVRYSEDGDILFISSSNRGKAYLFAYYPDQPDATFPVYQFVIEDFYDIPGNLVTFTGKKGKPAVRLSEDKKAVFLSAAQFYRDVEEKAPRPFLDRVEIKTGNKERIFQSSEEIFESQIQILDPSVNELVIRRESPSEYPNYWCLNLPDNLLTKLTENEDPNRAVSQAFRDRYKVKRADGIEFWVEVVMPADWDGEPLAGFIWHYPEKYRDQDDYNESLKYHNKNAYPKITPQSADILVKEGYAVLKPDWPIIGGRGNSNDNFVQSIVENSSAVIYSAEAKGYIDRSRMAIGGHSYGAFGATNAMIHTPFFKAGIAGSGNYNRTLTPFGFQQEKKDLWEATNRYIEMSPIFGADKLKGALLMYHGEQDQNSGTWPGNSERMFHALNGMGKTAAMYMYPYEDHKLSAKETLLDMWRRWVDWLDYHVKGKQEEPGGILAVEE